MRGLEGRDNGPVRTLGDTPNSNKLSPMRPIWLTILNLSIKPIAIDTIIVNLKYSNLETLMA